MTPLALSGSPVAGASGAAATGTVGLHVVHPGGGPGYLADASGRFVVLRGVDDNALIHYPSDYREAPPLHLGDLKEMAALGFNFLRLGVSWSEIMPRPGVIDTKYLERVHQVVSWARREGIGVVIDMHQDNYSTVTDPTQESDGAPPWAVVDKGVPCTPVATTTRCALAAFHAFWANRRVHGRGLQQWYLKATEAVALASGATERSSNVAGVEVMNEPWPDFGGPSPFEEKLLYPFYDFMVTGLRRAGVVTPLWFEPSILRDVTDDARSAAMRFSSDQDLVYAVHIYSGVFAPPFGPTASVRELSLSYDHAAIEAATFDTPFVVDEYGSDATPRWNSWLEAQLADQEKHHVGSGFWLWKQRRGRWDRWAVVNLDGSLRRGTQRAQLLSEPHLDAVPGRLVFEEATRRSLEVTVRGPGGTATFWGGTVVTGGRSLLRHSLDQVAIDGHHVPASCHLVRYSARSLTLAGCLVSVALPSGRHHVTLSP